MRGAPQAKEGTIWLNKRRLDGHSATNGLSVVLNREPFPLDQVSDISNSSQALGAAGGSRTRELGDGRKPHA